jgi:hypothetical protein
MAKSKGRQKSKAAQATAQRRATRGGDGGWEDQVARMDHPETSGFRSRLGDGPDAPPPAAPDAAALRRRSWIGAILTLGIAVAAGILLVWSAMHRDH